MKFYSSIFLLFMTLNSFAQFTAMNETEIAEFKQRVEKETQSISSIKTNFIQKKHMDFLAEDIVSKGKMLLNSENYLKWVYTSPEAYSIIFKNGLIYINDNGNKKEVNKHQIFKKINHIIASSVSGKLFNDPEFRVKFYKTTDHILVKSVPKNAGLKKYIAKVYLYFPKKGRATATNIKLVEPSGNYTFITFVNMQLNVKIEPAVFE